ncbi:MAG: uL15m family ribosomal protein [Candidatus Aenigmatarchaeota archaeon]
MVVRFRKKNERMRGSKTHGYGSKKKHRGKGSKGGKGYGGSTQQKRSYILRYEPNHFGHKGFNSLRKKNNIINVGDLEKLGNEIDLITMGYDKLLSKGDISKPIIVRVKKFSKMAKEKIEKAGGRVENA